MVTTTTVRILISLKAKTDFVQIMFLLLTTIMLKFTTLLPRDLFDESWKDTTEQSLLMV